MTKWLDEAGTDASEDLSVPNTDILESTELLQASLQSVDTTLAILTEKELRRPKESPSYYYPVWGYARTRLLHEPLRTNPTNVSGTASTPLVATRVNRENAETHLRIHYGVLLEKEKSKLHSNIRLLITNQKRKAD